MTDEKKEINEVKKTLLPEKQQSQDDLNRLKKALQGNKYEKKIFIVDDDKIFLKNLITFLKRSLPDYAKYLVLPVNGSADVLKKLNQFKTIEVYFDLIITDVSMPQMSGDQLIVEVRRTFPLRDLPIIALSGEDGAEAPMKMLGAMKFIHKYNYEDTLVSAIQLAFSMKEHLNKESLNNISLQLNSTTNFQHHSERMAVLGYFLAKRFAVPWSSNEFWEFYQSLLKHDIGKGIMDIEVFMHKGKLNDEQWVEMRRHPDSGYQFMKNLKCCTQVDMDVSRYHHEKYNGKGYPLGLKGDEIPLAAQIAGMADMTESLRSARPPYKGAFDFDKVMKIMTEENERGSFNPELWKKYIEVFKDSQILDKLLAGKIWDLPEFQDFTNPDDV